MLQDYRRIALPFLFLSERLSLCVIAVAAVTPGCLSAVHSEPGLPAVLLQLDHRSTFNLIAHGQMELQLPIGCFWFGHLREVMLLSSHAIMDAVHIALPSCLLKQVAAAILGRLCVP